VAVNDPSFFLYKGEHKTLRLTAKDRESGDPLDLTGAELRLTVRTRIGGEVAIEKDSAAGPSQAAIIGDPTDGVAEVYFVPDDTIPPAPAEPLEAACYAYDCFTYKQGGGAQKTIILIPPSRFDIRDAVTEW
jgi:hypothetical protein